MADEITGAAIDEFDDDIPFDPGKKPAPEGPKGKAKDPPAGRPTAEISRRSARTAPHSTPAATHNLEAEIAVLGAALLDNSILPEISNTITAETFTTPAHRLIYNALHRLTSRGEPADLLTLSEELRAASALETCGGPGYVSRLTSAVPTSANVRYYARILADCALRRRAAVVLEKITQELAGPLPPLEILEGLMSRAGELMNGLGPQGKPLQLMTVKDFLQAPPVSWLIENILFDGTFSILGGYTGFGKSIISLAIAKSIADGFPLFGKYRVMRTGPVLFVDEENSHSDLRDRMVAMKITEDLPLYFLSFQGIFIDDDKSYTRLLQKIAEVKPVLVIFDSLVRFHHAQENDASEMSQVLGRLRQIVNSGPGVFALHHHGKALGALEVRARGSSDIIGACDVEYSLYKDREKNLVLCSVKSRRAPISPVTLKIEELEDELLVTCLGTATEQRQDMLDMIVEVLQTTALSFAEIEDALINSGYTMPKKTLRDALTELSASGKIKVKTGAHNRKIYSSSFPEEKLE